MARSDKVEDYNGLKGRFKEYGRKQREKERAKAAGLGGYGGDPAEDMASAPTGSKATKTTSRGQKRQDERALGAPAKPQTADDAMAALTDDKIGQDIATSGAAYRQEVAPVKAATAAAKAPGTQEAKMLADLGSSDLSYNPSVDDPQVRTLQKTLKAAGYSITEDGRFGPNTQAAVKDFQRKMRVPVTGVVDAATRESLAQTAGGDVSMMGTDFTKPPVGRRGAGAAAPAAVDLGESPRDRLGESPADRLGESSVDPDEPGSKAPRADDALTRILSAPDVETAGRETFDALRGVGRSAGKAARVPFDALRDTGRSAGKAARVPFDALRDTGRQVGTATRSLIVDDPLSSYDEQRSAELEQAQQQERTKGLADYMPPVFGGKPALGELTPESAPVYAQFKRARHTSGPVSAQDLAAASDRLNNEEFDKLARRIIDEGLITREAASSAWGLRLRNPDTVAMR